MKMKFLVGLIVGLGLVTFGKSQSMQNIAPLQTTRGEVETMFGDKYEVKDGFCTHPTSEGIYYFYYSTEPCKATSVRWNVSNNILLSYGFEPKKKEKFPYLNNNELIIVGYGYHSRSAYFVDEKKGIVYSVNAENEIESLCQKLWK